MLGGDRCFESKVVLIASSYSKDNDKENDDYYKSSETTKKYISSVFCFSLLRVFLKY